MILTKEMRLKDSHNSWMLIFVIIFICVFTSFNFPLHAVEQNDQNQPEREKNQIKNPIESFLILIFDSGWKLFKSFICPLYSCECIDDSSRGCRGKEPIIHPITFDCDATKKIWAIIISPPQKNESDSITFSYDTNDIYGTIDCFKVPPEQIFYIKPKCPVKKGDLPAGNLKYENKINCEDVSIKSIQYYLGQIESGIMLDDKFFIFISTHGTENGVKIGEEELKYCQLNCMLNKIPCKTQIVVINSCYSGVFIRNLIVNYPKEIHRIAIASSMSESNVDLDNDNFDLNPWDRGSEFVSGFIASFSDKTADVDSDEKISLSEAFNYAKEHACCADNIMTRKYFGKGCYTPVILSTPGTCTSKVSLFWDEKTPKPCD